MNLEELVNGPYKVLFPESELMIELQEGWLEVTITMKWGQLTWAATNLQDLQKLISEPILRQIVNECHELFKASGKEEDYFIFNI